MPRPADTSISDFQLQNLLGDSPYILLLSAVWYMRLCHSRPVGVGDKGRHNSWLFYILMLCIQQNLVPIFP